MNYSIYPKKIKKNGNDMKDSKHWWIETYTGKKFHYLDLKPEQFDILDIAKALSKICRYAGHLERFLSVAEHSVNVASLIEDTEAKKWGLLHDAAEAYTSDIPRPLKWMVSEIEDIEKNIQLKIIDVFNIPITSNIIKEVRRADQIMLITEREQLKPNMIPWGYYEDIEPVDMIIRCVNPADAEMLFLENFAKIFKTGI